MSTLYPPGHTPEPDMEQEEAEELMDAAERATSPEYARLARLEADGLLTILCATCPHPDHLGAECEELVPEPYPGADEHAAPELVRCGCPQATHNGDKAWVALQVRRVALGVISLAQVCSLWDQDPGHKFRTEARTLVLALRAQLDELDEALV